MWRVSDRTERLMAVITMAVVPIGIVAVALTAAPSSVTGQECAARLSDPAPLSTPDREWLERCVSALNPTPLPSTTPSTTTSPPSSIPPPTTQPPTVPAQSCPPRPAFPDASCTGVPAGITLTTYTGPCTITTPNTVIDSKLVNCVLHPRAAGIVIRNSRIIGGVYGNTGASAPSFIITDSEIVAPQVGSNSEANGLGEANFVGTRLEVTGGNRGVYCRFNATLRDSWVHGTNISATSNAHASAVRQSQGCTLVHNRLQCSAQDTPQGGGCSADLTGYGDFEPVANNLVQDNFFVTTPGGACAYGGSSGDDGVKPFGNQAHDIRFINNVFDRGPVGDHGTRNCGFYFPITDFDSTRPGNVWTGNTWIDGGLVPPAN